MSSYSLATAERRGSLSSANFNITLEGLAFVVTDLVHGTEDGQGLLTWTLRYLTGAVKWNIIKKVFVYPIRNDIDVGTHVQFAFARDGFPPKPEGGRGLLGHPFSRRFSPQRFDAYSRGAEHHVNDS